MILDSKHVIKLKLYRFAFVNYHHLESF